MDCIVCVVMDYIQGVLDVYHVVVVRDEGITLEGFDS